MQRRSTNSDSGRSPMVVRSAISIGSLGISIGGMMFAPPQTTRAQVDPSIAKTKVNLQAVPVESVFEAPIEPSYTIKEPIVESQTWEPEYIEPEYTEPAYIEPEYVEEAIEQPEFVPEETQEPIEGSHSYIDTTDYSLGATTSYDESPAVVLSERSTGCEATVAAGEGVPGSVCAPVSPTATKPTVAAAAGFNSGQPVAVPNVSVPELEVPAPSVAAVPVGVGYSVAAVPDYYPVAEVPALDLNGIVLGAAGFIPKPGEDSAQIYNAYYNVAAQALRDRSVRPQDLIARVSSRLVFPLSIPAPITSAFGLRVHPVLGTAQMHTGTDIGAPMGTPVVAALAGRVAISDFLGGYGLTVVLEHEKGTKETLYGHLSEVFVKAGDTVKKGDPIGRVGSTGLSTGPHLHFEVRKLTKEGWVNLDPGRQLEYGLAQLVRNLRTIENAPATPPTVLDTQTAESEVLDDISQGPTSSEDVADTPSS